MPLSKFAHIKTISQIGAQQPKTGSGGNTFGNSSSEGHLLKQSNENLAAIHKTHLSSISGTNAVMNGSAQTIPSPLMKFVHPKVKDGAITASSQNLKHRVTGSSEANFAEHSLHLNFQLE